MCDGCAKLDATVANKLGLDADVVRRVRLAVYEAMRALDEAEVDVPEVQPGTMPVVTMVPLGLEPYILIRLPVYRPVPDGGAVANVALVVGGGIHENHVASVLDAALERWELRHGGVDSDGNLIEPAERHG